MATFTSSLPDDLLENLSKMAKELKMPKNRIIEKALQLYLDELNKAQYIKSFKRASQDKEVMAMAEEGIADYFRMLQEYDEK
ncbi:MULTISPECIES: ribbon-helix-helix domain-containing protein [Aequorivita]|uniref:Ribbon-helix-helix domain-containing protein n=2 Tax=Aequorivita TaxID=153265 RepID=A0AB35YUU4_9FLAO|nr:ribbon-helix-helix domain-containing protein [Aequorivita sp. Ant34-E75]WGF92921.1 ribbon-helix-helix domain-containing protein [Aequorivita sp. Ant34-E75]